MLIGVIVVLFSARAMAESPSHRVTGVRLDDVLNVRRAPSSSSPVIGALSAQAAGVLVRERRGAWARVQRGTTQGWVAARFLTPFPTWSAYLPPDQGSWSCQGFEPIWTMRMTNGQIQWFDGEELRAVMSEVRQAESDLSISTFRFSARGNVIAVFYPSPFCTLPAKPSELAHYTHNMVLIRDAFVAHGCCTWQSLGPAATAPAP
jgi:uncharacterized membrane protein